MLITHVKARFGGSSSQYLTNLTRMFGGDGGGTIDDAVLQLACDDVIADMETLAGLVYDDSATTNSDDYAKHISTGVLCVVIKLQLYSGKTPDKKISLPLMDRYDKLMVQLSKVTSRDRFFVESNSPYQPSDQTLPDGNPILPDFDDSLTSFFTPGANAGLNGSTNPQTDP